jgi:acyl-CoA thioesterase-1
MKLMLCLFCLSLNSFLYAATTVLFMGDSLTEGYGVNKKKSYPSLIANKLAVAGHPIKLINGSISGSTTASAVSRLKWFLKTRPSVMFLALGGNDALRGIAVKEAKKNLEKTIKLARENKVKVILGGMMAPPNYGTKYMTDFKSIYSDLAKKYKLVLVPFLLENVAGEKKLNQSDGIHPNEKGHLKIFDTVYPYILKAIKNQ